MDSVKYSLYAINNFENAFFQWLKSIIILSHMCGKNIFFAHQDIVFRHNDALLEMLEFAQMCEEESVFGVAGAK